MDTVVRPKGKTNTKEQSKTYPLYHVILLNDEHHSYQYVIKMTMQLFWLKEADALNVARKVDKDQQAIVATLTKEQAEFKQEQVHAYGPDSLIPECQGSMTAVLEPVR